MKQLNRPQLERRKDQTVRFVGDVLGDPDRAVEIEAESLENYAERRKVKLINPVNRRSTTMARGKTKAELEAEIPELQDENRNCRTASTPLATSSAYHLQLLILLWRRERDSNPR